MAERIHWLRDLQDGPWSGIADAMRKGIPVPDGFVVRPETPEREIRDAYEELKTKEHTHYVAVRGGIRAQLDVIGPDRLIHSLRESWNESPGGERPIQAMINAAWSGNARREASILSNNRASVGKATAAGSLMHAAPPAIDHVRTRK